MASAEGHASTSTVNQRTTKGSPGAALDGEKEIHEEYARKIRNKVCAFRFPRNERKSLRDFVLCTGVHLCGMRVDRPRVPQHAHHLVDAADDTEHRLDRYVAPEFVDSSTFHSRPLLAPSQSSSATSFAAHSSTPLRISRGTSPSNAAPRFSTHPSIKPVRKSRRRRSRAPSGSTGCWTSRGP